MEASPELRDLTVRLAEAIGAGDADFLARHTSRQAGAAFLGTDPDEWWTDVAGLTRALAAQRQIGIEGSRASRWPTARGASAGRSIGGCGSASATGSSRSACRWSTTARTGRGRWSTSIAQSACRMRTRSALN